MKYIAAFTIAGSDPSGGAGIQADMKTMSAIGVYACSAITAVTVQNTLGVEAVCPLPKDIVRGQIAAVMSDIRPDAVKIGMLNDRSTVEAVVDALEEYRPRFVVLDPVMVSSSGRRLLSDDAVRLVVERLFPLSTLITPNIPEAEALTGMSVTDNDGRCVAARRILDMGAQAVLVKGGHSATRVKSDLLVTVSGTEKWFSMLGVETRNTHGTGCTLSSAICAYLALGEQLDQAVLKAKRYVQGALKAGADMELGHGTGPLGHFGALKDVE